MHPRSPLFLAAGIVLVVSSVSMDVSRAGSPRTTLDSVRVDEAVPVNPSEAATTESPALRTFPLPPDVPVRRQVVGVDGAPVVSGVGEAKLVYSNTLGKLAVPLANGAFISDDLTLLTGPGCSLRRYTFQVIGKADPQDVAGGAYRVDFVLYDDCPSAGGKAIAGAGGFVQFPAGQDNVLQEVEFVVPDDVTVSIPSTVWLALKANRENVGVIIGTPALVGFSDDKVDFPGIACAGDAGSFPSYPHASFNATVYVDSACADAYPAYRNVQPGRNGFTEGANECMADDLALNVDGCDMVVYEVHVRGPGLYKFDLREDANGLPGAVIAGTAKTRPVPGTAQGAQRLQFAFDPPIALPPKVWLTFQAHTSSAGWILTRRGAEIGITARTYARSFSGAACDSVSDWEATNLQISTDPGNFDVTIVCVGSPPVGACCDMFLLDDAGEAVCREVPEMNCPASNVFPRVEWVGGASCDSGPFTHTCGVSACCTPDDTCENLTKNECAALYPPTESVTWQQLHFCEDDDQKCPFYHCVQRNSESCVVGHESPGCDNPFCCQEVGDLDSWCAQVEWDRMCLRESIPRSSCYDAVPNDYCGPTRGALEPSAMLLQPNTSVVLVNEASTYQDDPGFSCHSGFPAHCQGGSYPPAPCEVDNDCEPFGACVPQTPMPDQQGAGTMWFRFVATDGSARVSTCNSDASVDDTLIAVYRPADPSWARACETLAPLACNDDLPACGTGRNATVCVDGLVAGETYYIQVANKLYGYEGVIQLDLKSPCAHAMPTGPGQTVLDRPESAASAPLKALPDESAAGDASGMVRAAPDDGRLQHREVPNDPPRPRPVLAPAGAIAHRGPWVRGPYASVQVNVDAEGNNIVGDAANEPSIAMDPSDPSKIVIGWRQFDSVESNFRQAGYAYSKDGGVRWTFSGTLAPGIFGSDPVLATGPDGEVYYLSIDFSQMRFFRSFDAGVSWEAPRVLAYGFLDKPWMTVDTTSGSGRGNIYVFAMQYLLRSFDGGRRFELLDTHAFGTFWGTMAVGLEGELYLTAFDRVLRSRDAKRRHNRPIFEDLTPGGLPGFGSCGGGVGSGGGPNPGGLYCQPWIAVDHSDGPTRGHIYVVGPGVHLTPIFHAGIVLERSRDGGVTWDPPVSVSDEENEPFAEQWFSTMSVAPNGRIDVIWNDTRNSGRCNLSEVFYSYSTDGGTTWSKNVPISPMWDSWIGWPQQNKIGDYYHMISDNAGANLAYAATFNGEQDVYFLRIGPRDCNLNGVLDEEDISQGTSEDCDGNLVPDECGRDCNRNGAPDPCESLDGDAPDCNENLVPDGCERNYDLDGLIDDCDPDIDGDGVANVLDHCAFTPLGTHVNASGRPTGDTNKNCRLDLVDYWRFRNCMMNGLLGSPAPREACLAAFDVNGDERFDLVDAAAFLRSFGGEP